jgi:hypothetical protein
MSERTRTNPKTGVRVIPGTCSRCAAQVTDLALHKQWHDELDASLHALQPAERAADS